MTSDLQPSDSFLRGLRICFVAGTLGQGGAERQLYYILKCLKAAGTDVSLLCLTQGEHWEKQIRELGVSVEKVGQFPSRLSRLSKIAKEVRRIRPDVVQSQHFYTNIYAAVSARLARCISIGAVRNTGLFDLNSIGFGWRRVSLALPSLVAANSKQAIFNLTGRGWPQSRFFLLPNVIDTDHFKPAARRAEEQFTILGIGRLGPEKRFDRFIQILDRLAKCVQKPIRAWIVGTGRQRAYLQELIDRTQHTNLSITLLGAVRDPLPLYQAADMLLLTSDHEGTPNVVLEAMASGVPVVATCVGDVPDLLGDGERGYLMAPDDIDGLVSALSDLLRSEQTRVRLSNRAREYVQLHRSVMALNDHLIKLYHLALVK